MNFKNYQYLTETLADLGFGDFFNDQLRTKIELGFQKFEVLGDNTKSNGNYIRYAPQLERSKSEEYKDRYFLNAIRATHKDANGRTLASVEFKIFKKSGFSVEEMEKLLIEGRAVYREFKNDDGEKQGKYYRLDLANPDENGKVQIISYSGKMNIDRELDKLNIQWSSKKEREEAVIDLKSGERVTVSVKIDGELKRASLESAPHLGGLAVLNNEGTVIKYTNSQAQSMQAVSEPGQTNSQAMQAISQASPGNELVNSNGKSKDKAQEVLEAMNTQQQAPGRKNTPK